MRFRIRSEDEEYVDKELTKLMKKLSKARKEGNNKVKPDKEAVRMYIIKAIKIIENKAKAKGLDEQAMEYILRRAETILKSNYPEQINLDELLDNLINEYRSHQK